MGTSRLLEHASFRLYNTRHWDRRTRGLHIQRFDGSTNRPASLRGSQHPKTGQQRITMTGTAILKSSAILIPVIGADKQEIMEHLIHKQGVYPASYILSRSSTATLFTDRIIE